MEQNKYHWTAANFHLLLFTAVNDAAQLESSVRKLTRYSDVLDAAQECLACKCKSQNNGLGQRRTSCLTLSVRKCYVISNVKRWMMKMEQVGCRAVGGVSLN